MNMLSSTIRSNPESWSINIPSTLTKKGNKHISSKPIIGSRWLASKFQYCQSCHQCIYIFCYVPHGTQKNALIFENFFDAGPSTIKCLTKCKILRQLRSQLVCFIKTSDNCTRILHNNITWFGKRTRRKYTIETSCVCESPHVAARCAQQWKETQIFQSYKGQQTASGQRHPTTELSLLQPLQTTSAKNVYNAKAP